MKYQLAKPFLFLVVFILIVGLACGTSTPDEPAPAEEVEAPVQEPPTSPPPTPEPVAQEYYTEDFSGDTSQWTYFLVKGGGNPTFSENDFGTMYVGVEDERILFDLGSEGQWAYVTYDAYEYDNVRIDVVAENRGVNTNNVSLICRYTPDEGWYEFNIANNGLFWIFHAIIRADGNVIYTEIADGGSNKIKAGKETNTYSIICNERTLSLFINGHETRVLEENNYVLRDGQIGVSVSSFDVLPVKVEIDSVTISQP
ncbi:MAG: hypothetical protein ISR59_11620 [Anaerolineales bacterium]|nr:hypothetical protein [Anaerolineales bacterium]